MQDFRLPEPILDFRGRSFTALALKHNRTRERIVPEGGIQTPSYALRPMPVIPNPPKDDLGRDLAVLLYEHPEIRENLRVTDIASLSVSDKAQLLSQVKSALGIRPIRNRRVGYVGPR